MGRAAAFFDVDNTIARGNIVSYYVYIRTYGMAGIRKKLWWAAFMWRVPVYYFLDKISRRLFSLLFYRNYRNVKPQTLDARAEAYFEEFWRARVYPQAAARIKQHQSQGHQVVLVTGSLLSIVEPLAAYLGGCRLIGCRLCDERGSFTGKLEGGPLTGHRKAQAIQEFAHREGIDLGRSYAYADSYDDIEMLSSVGTAGVVNPGYRLKKKARQKGWEILQWEVGGAEC
ncbi:MAG: HAD family hydrolase [Acidobacteriota bacterium]